MQKCTGCFFFASLALFTTVSGFSLETDHYEPVECVRPFPVVAFQRETGKELQHRAEELAKFLGVQVVQAADKNPVCCVWLEITAPPNPGRPGYIILHQAGGTSITASNIEQLDLALEKWKSKMCRTGDAVEFPEGILTSYTVVK